MHANGKSRRSKPSTAFRFPPTHRACHSNPEGPRVSFMFFPAARTGNSYRARRHSDGPPTFQRERLQPPPPVASSFPRAPRAISRRPRGLAARAVSKPQRRRPPAIGISVGTTRRQPRCVCLARLAMMAALHGPYPRQEVEYAVRPSRLPIACTQATHGGTKRNEHKGKTLTHDPVKLCAPPPHCTL